MAAGWRGALPREACDPEATCALRLPDLELSETLALYGVSAQAPQTHDQHFAQYPAKGMGKDTPGREGRDAWAGRARGPRAVALGSVCGAGEFSRHWRGIEVPGRLIEGR